MAEVGKALQQAIGKETAKRNDARSENDSRESTLASSGDGVNAGTSTDINPGTGDNAALEIKRDVKQASDGLKFTLSVSQQAEEVKKRQEKSDEEIDDLTKSIDIASNSKEIADAWKNIS